jgi:SAM-dependent methyltransferase
MSRWSAAAARLSIPAGSRVLDLGCAFGYGTRLLRGQYETYGHDLSPVYIERARATVPGVTFTCGPADRVPYPDSYFDAVLLLDVLEHVPNVPAVAAEIRRVLRTRGQLIVSVPHSGLLASLDSLNVYCAWFGDDAPPPTDDPSWKLRPHHRHFNLSEVEHIFSPGFRLQSTRYTGIGLAELVNLVLLVLFRRILPLPRLYAALQYIYFGVYLAEDHIPTGRLGYHLMVAMERT